MPNSASHPEVRRGFTLVELMISIAIVLLLVAGINLIFSTTSKAVSAGQALSEGARNNQAAQAVMYRDFAAAVTDASAPYLMIYNHVTPAFRTLADQQGDRDYDASASVAARRSAILTVDLDDNNTEGESSVPGEIIDSTEYNDRNHRTDMISFFARDLFKRQTGNPGTYVANESANEAMVWYGHLYQPNNSGAYSADTLPGAGTFGANNNPNNFFATQWILGRQTILLNGDPGVAPRDSAGTQQNYFQTNTAAVDLTPLTFLPIFGGTPATFMPGYSDDTSGFAAIKYARYDICDTSFGLFRKRIVDYPAAAVPPWWQQLAAGNNATRFASSSFLSKPITSAEFAKTAPIFLTGCSQFIVEFAGDFVKQNSGTGAIEPGGPDSVIDFVINPTTGARRTRWFGMPRNTETTGETIASGPVIRAADGDVTPLYAFAGAQTFEHPTGIGPGPDFVGAVAANAEYVCAWGPSESSLRPWMIRITYALDDANSRLGNPLIYEYVFKLK